MVSDGIENCVMYANNFNPEKSQNPFAYFTQIIYYAFLRRIEKEKKQLYIKYKTMNEFDSLKRTLIPVLWSQKISSQLDFTTSDKRATIYDFIYAFEEEKKEEKTQRDSRYKTCKDVSLTTYLTRNFLHEICTHNRYSLWTRNDSLIFANSFVGFTKRFSFQLL